MRPTVRILAPAGCHTASVQRALHVHSTCVWSKLDPCRRRDGEWSGRHAPASHGAMSKRAHDPSPADTTCPTGIEAGSSSAPSHGNAQNRRLSKDGERRLNGSRHLMRCFQIHICAFRLGLCRFLIHLDYQGNSAVERMRSGWPWKAAQRTRCSSSSASMSAKYALTSTSLLSGYPCSAGCSSGE